MLERRSMKNFIVLFAMMFCIGSNPSQAAGTLAALAAAGEIGKELAPVIKQLAEETLVEGVGSIKGLMKGEKCFIGCTGPISHTCYTRLLNSICLNNCQRVINIGKYTILLRFGEKTVGNKQVETFSLRKCIHNALTWNKRHKKKVPIYPEEPNTIAVYSLETYKVLKEDLDMIEAARKIIDSSGEVLYSHGILKKSSDPKIMKENKEKVALLIRDAEVLRGNLKTALKKNIKKGIYGPQFILKPEATADELPQDEDKIGPDVDPAEGSK